MRTLDNIGRTQSGRLGLFFVIAVVLAWLVWVPAAMVTYGLPGYQLPLFGLVGTMGPGVAAFLVAGLFEGRAGVRDLIRRLRVWRVGIRWYGVAIFTRLLLSLTAFYGYGLLTGQPLTGATVIWSSLLVTILVQVPNTLLEEIGWRGYAYPRLMPGRKALFVGLLFGVFHTAWHIPYWLTASVTQAYGLAFLLLAALIVITMTVVFTWMWLNTKGSVLLAWLFHLAMNTTTVYVPLSPDVTGSLGPQALEVALMLVVAALAGMALARRPVEPGPLLV